MAGKICPVWIGYMLLNPLRRILQNPAKILKPCLRKGMRVMDYGSAMGFFSIPMAREVGPEGRVVCVDIQEKMLEVLARRAARAGVGGIIESCLISGSAPSLERYRNGIDFVLLFAVAHEVPDQEALFRELFQALKPGGKMLFSEPSGHLSRPEYDSSVALAEEQGFRRGEAVRIRGGFSLILEKPE